MISKTIIQTNKDLKTSGNLIPKVMLPNVWAEIFDELETKVNCRFSSVVRTDLIERFIYD